MLGRALRRAGVRTGRLLRARGRPTTVAVVIVERGTGERRFVVADRGPYERAVPDFDLAPIRESSILLIDGHFPVQTRRAVRHARAVGATVVADFNRPTRDAVALLPDVDYPVVPLEFALAYAGADPRDAVRSLRREYGGTPIVTSGALGGYYWSKGRVRRYRSPRVRVRDTTGAGDAFHGAFAASLARGRSPDEAVERAARAGARCCTALGATGHLQPPEEAVRGGRRASRR